MPTSRKRGTAAKIRKSSCQLCGTDKGKLTREHVFPQWAWADVPSTELRIEGTPLLVKTPERIIVPVCEPCQRWLSREFETPAQDLIRPMSHRVAQILDSDAQSFVGRYMTKTALLLGRWQHATAHLTIPMKFLKEFHRSGGTSPLATVWIGALMDDYEARTGIFVGRVPQIPDMTSTPFRMPPRTTGGLLQFRGLVVNWVLEERPTLNASAPGYGIPAVAAAESARLLTRIWPAETATVDFPGEEMSIETYYAIQWATETDPVPFPPQSQSGLILP